MAPKWRQIQKLRFLLSYFFFKLIVPFEVHNDRWRLFVFEWSDFFQNLRNQFRTPVFDLSWQGAETVVTKFGSYKVRRGTQDITVISPSFERLDLNRMLKMADELSANGEKFTFLDIGANIGRYAVAVGNRAKGLAEIHAFEPDVKTFEILKQNMAFTPANLHQIGLSDVSGEAKLTVNTLRPWDQGLGNPNGVNVPLDTLDNRLKSAAPGGNLLIKMDVDGHELSVLAGAKNILQGRNIKLLIEDVCEREAIYKKLTEIGFQPVCKLTLYNSWWEMKAAPV